MEGDCLSCMKYLMFVFNFFIFLGGACLLGVGIWVMVDPTGFREIVAANPLLITGAYILLAMGGLLFLLGFLGCCGAVRENKCLLLLLKQEMGSIVTKLIQNYTDGHEDSLQEAWDYVQAQVKCCGWVSFYNWTENAELMSRINITYPCSCENKSQEGDNSILLQTGFCEAPAGNGTQSSNNPDGWPVYKEGCMEKVQAWLQENLGIILGVCVGVAVIELLGMLLSMFLCRHVHSEDYSKVPKY
eukprot:XP_028357277.1 CD82 antigen [Physeter catodon]